MFNNDSIPKHIRVSKKIFGTPAHPFKNRDVNRYYNDTRLAQIILHLYQYSCTVVCEGQDLLTFIFAIKPVQIYETLEKYVASENSLRSKKFKIPLKNIIMCCSYLIGFNNVVSTVNELGAM